MGSRPALWIGKMIKLPIGRNNNCTWLMRLRWSMTWMRPMTLSPCWKHIHKVMLMMLCWWFKFCRRFHSTICIIWRGWRTSHLSSVDAPVLPFLCDQRTWLPAQVAAGVVYDRVDSDLPPLPISCRPGWIFTSYNAIYEESSEWAIKNKVL